MQPEQALKIERKPLELFAITMNMPLTAAIQVMAGSNQTFMRDKETQQGQDVEVLVQFDYKINSVSDDFNLIARTVRRYGLSPFNKITPLGIYQCAVISQSEVQEYLDKVFEHLQDKPQVPIKPFEELEPFILKMIEDIYK